MSSGPAPWPARARAQQPLSPLCTLGVGGPAQWLLDVRSLTELREALQWARHRGWPVTILGGCSNVVIADSGLLGLTLQVQHESVRCAVSGREVRVRAGAGLEWDDLVELAVSRGWAGLECLSGIPGKVGATPIQNVGAYGQEVSQVIDRISVVVRESGELQEIAAADCGFGYRQSRFKGVDADRFVVWEVCFRLRVGAPPTLTYPELANRLAVPKPSLREARQAVLGLRQSKEMLHRSGGRGSCGSFFVNPVVSDEARAALANQWGLPPSYPQPNGRWKLPAAWLIERAGFRKGQRWGRAGLSERHALAITADPGASANEVVSVARRVRDGVQQKLNVALQPEPRFLGFGGCDSGGLPREPGSDAGSPS